MEALTVFWGQYFPETPVCSHPDCEFVASEVDSFFPYIDDFNRCEAHPQEFADPRKFSVPACDRAAGRNSLNHSGHSGNGGRAHGTVRNKWRPPR